MIYKTLHRTLSIEQHEPLKIRSALVCFFAFRSLVIIAVYKIKERTEYLDPKYFKTISWALISVYKKERKNRIPRSEVIKKAK